MKSHNQNENGGEARRQQPKTTTDGEPRPVVGVTLSGLWDLLTHPEARKLIDESQTVQEFWNTCEDAIFMLIILRQYQLITDRQATQLIEKWHRQDAEIPKTIGAWCRDRWVRACTASSRLVEKQLPTDACDRLYYELANHIDKAAELQACIVHLVEVLQRKPSLDRPVIELARVCAVSGELLEMVEGSSHLMWKNAKLEAADLIRRIVPLRFEEDEPAKN